MNVLYALIKLYRCVRDFKHLKHNIAASIKKYDLNSIKLFNPKLL